MVTTIRLNKKRQVAGGKSVCHLSFSPFPKPLILIAMLRETERLLLHIYENMSKKEMIIYK